MSTAAKARLELQNIVSIGHSHTVINIDAGVWWVGIWCNFLQYRLEDGRLESSQVVELHLDPRTVSITFSCNDVIYY